MTVTINGTTGIAGTNGSAGTPAVQGEDTNTGIFFPAADTIAFAEGGAEVARFDSSGNLGIGTTSPSYALSVARNSSSEIAIQAVNAGIGQATLRLQNSLRHWAIFVDDGASGPLRFYDYTAAAERARIDASGNLLVGTTSAGGVGTTIYRVASGNSGAPGAIHFNGSSTATETCMSFQYNGTAVGSITRSTTATAYVTSSDYRLKENVAPMQNALDTVAQLNPVTYTWKADGSAGQGFIAHELQAVVPDCVTGEKDAVDETGNPQYQGVDTSFLVATLVKAIQELTARVAQLEAQ